MSLARERFRNVLSKSTCTLAANIFDPLSARIAHHLGYDVCVLSGSVGKVANLGAPDSVLSNMSDVVDHCRRITRISDVTLMVDAEDGFGNAVNVMRTVREMEAAGVSAIEIEDNVVPKRLKMADWLAGILIRGSAWVQAPQSIRLDSGLLRGLRNMHLKSKPCRYGFSLLMRRTDWRIPMMRGIGLSLELVPYLLFTNCVHYTIMLWLNNNR